MRRGGAAYTVSVASSVLLQHRAIIINLFKPYLGGQILNPEQKYYVARAAEITKQAVAELRRLVRLHAFRSGFAHGTSYTVHILLMIAFASLEELEPEYSHSEGRDAESYCMIETCIKGLVEMSRRYCVAQAALRILEMAAEELRVKLDPELQKLATTYNTEEWVRDVTEHLRSQYPLDVSPTVLE
ncbi:hypothetical protein LTR66_011043 [Elasticomyces elasticus]|nr:hypothetical protein LTR66_011043 [Elasticomyces elasticus]KAK5011068.1 hypothetical protein LTR28_005963 [Elasticomyces elasticus]